MFPIHLIMSDFNSDSTQLPLSNIAHTELPRNRHSLERSDFFGIRYLADAAIVFKVHLI